MSFVLSSHCQSWILSPDDVDQIRHNLIKSSIDDVDVCNTLPKNRKMSEVISKEDRNLLEQEYAAIIYYCGIIQSCFSENADDSLRPEGIKKKHWRVASTAISYFWRFYLNNSLLIYDPRTIMITCVYLAGKVEECRVSFRELFTIHQKCSAEVVIEHELLLLQALNYQLQVYHPFNIMNTLIADYKKISEEHDRQASETAKQSAEGVQQASAIRKDWRKHAGKFLLVVECSMVGLCFTPFEIAITALIHTQPSSLSLRFEDYLNRRFNNILVQEFYERIEKITSLKEHVELLERDSEKTQFKQFTVRVKKQSKWSKKSTKKKKTDNEC